MSDYTLRQFSDKEIDNDDMCFPLRGSTQKFREQDGMNRTIVVCLFFFLII